MGGAGTRFAATYANVRRVKVTNRDGSQQVVELSDEGGLSITFFLSLIVLSILTRLILDDRSTEQWLET